MEPVSKGEADNLLDYLFRRIVKGEAGKQELQSIKDQSRSSAQERVENVEAKTPKDLLKRALQRVPQTRSDYFQSNYHISCPVTDGVEADISFSYAYANGTPRRLFEWINFPKTAETLERNVYSSVFKFEKVKNASYLDSSNCISLVYYDEGRRGEKAVRQSLKMLRGVGTVVDIRDEKRVEETLDG